MLVFLLLTTSKIYDINNHEEKIMKKYKTDDLYFVKMAEKINYQYYVHEKYYIAVGEINETTKKTRFFVIEKGLYLGEQEKGDTYALAKGEGSIYKLTTYTGDFLKRRLYEDVVFQLQDDFNDELNKQIELIKEEKMSQSSIKILDIQV